MRFRMGILAFAFLVFYAMIHLGQYLPDLYYGKFSLVDERDFALRVRSLLIDMGIAFCFTFCAYYFLFLNYAARKYFLILLALPLSFVLIFWVSYLVAQWDSGMQLRLSRFFRGQILYDGFYTIFGLAFYFVRYGQYKELQEKQLVILNRESSLALLRSQINPHFLFNNLNNIYSLVYHQSDQSLPAISGLSELLRYMLYDNKEVIGLDEEINYLEKYIALEQLRFERPCKINFHSEGDFSQVQLPPLLLIPFIENAFKHGAISFEKTWLDINIYTDANRQVLMSCTNDFALKNKDSTGGIGIDNVRKRLALLYPDNHDLTIDPLNHTFKVALRLGRYDHQKITK